MRTLPLILALLLLPVGNANATLQVLFSVSGSQVLEFEPSPDRYDVNGDGTPEIVVEEESLGVFTFQAYTGQGAIVWNASFTGEDVCPGCQLDGAAFYGFTSMRDSGSREALFHVYNYSDLDGTVILDTVTGDVLFANDSLYPSRAADFDGDSLDEVVVKKYGVWALVGETSTGTGSPAPITGSAVRLEEIRPNPFNPRTTITFTLEESRDVWIEAYDARGRQVSRVPLGELPRGEHEVNWDAVDQFGHPLASGVYHLTVAADRNRVARRAVLLK